MTATEFEADVKVEYYIYAGVENPQIRLTWAQRRELERRVSDLRVCPPGTVFRRSERPGYAGFVVGAGRHWTEFEVFDGQVAITDGHGATTVWADPGRTLERWLLLVVRPNIRPQAFEQGRRHIGGVSLVA